MKQKKTTQKFRKHSTGKVQQPRKTKRYLDREDRKKTAQGRVSHRQGSTTKDNRKIAKREHRKETAQGKVSQGQGSYKRKQQNGIAERRSEKKQHKLKYLKSKVPQPERERILDREQKYRNDKTKIYRR